MKNHLVRDRISVTQCIVGLAFVAMAMSPVKAKDVCELVFTSCPDNFDGDTITVSDDVVALSAEVLACKPTDIREGIDTTVVDSGGPPSVVFLIDNSGSMTGTGNAERDRWGSRYTVVRDLLDTIAAVHPNAEVGIVVFREYLYFDDRSNESYTQYFKRMPQTYDNNQYQAYLPLMQLDKTYQGNKTGLDIIKEVLETDTLLDTADNYKYVDLKFTPEFSHEGWTNINVGMLATTEALKTAQYPKDRQFVIFLSDGVPRGTYDAGLDPNWFQGGTNMPTTFTVFFTDSGVTSAPASLNTMTTNIKNNNYSTTNTSSELWTITTSYNTLMELLTESVLGFIINWAPVVSTGTPTNMVINNKTPSSQTDTSFVYEQKFALEADLSRFTMSITYKYTNQKTKATRDSTINLTFYVKREVGADLDPGVKKICWTQPTLDLLYSGTSVIGDTVDETMEKLQVQLTPNDQQLSSANVIVGSSLEEENITLTLSQAVWQNDFLRYIASTGAAGDLKLQHKSIDSIVVVWRNPQIPLDTVRISVPFKVSRSMVAQSAFYFDNNADGYVDSIYVQLNVDSLMSGDLDQLKKWVTLPSTRSFSNVRYVKVDGGFAILVEESTSSDPRTSTDAGDVLKVAEGVFSHGGVVTASDVAVQDKMAPVIVSALLVTADTLGDSLSIQFSESVARVTYSEPFRFKTKAGTAYRVSLSSLSAGAGTQQAFRVANVSSEVEDQQPSDSIWISEIGQVVDSKGNKQENPANRRVPLQIKQAPYSIIPYPVNNPYSFDQGISGPQAQQIQQSITYVERVYAKPENSSLNLPQSPQPGPIVVVQPQGKLRSSTKLSGKVSIFDVVKNVIIEDHPMAFDSESKQLVYMWNGINKNGKKVATGTYVAVMTITDNYGLEETRTVRIGVKR